MLLLPIAAHVACQKGMSLVTVFCNFLSHVNFVEWGKTIIEPHGRGVPEAILNDRSPRAGLPECRRSPHEGRPARGERSLSMAEGTPCLEVLFLLYPPSP